MQIHMWHVANGLCGQAQNARQLCGANWWNALPAGTGGSDLSVTNELIALAPGLLR